MTAVDAAADAIAAGDARAAGATAGPAAIYRHRNMLRRGPFDSRPPRESQPYEPPPPGYEPIILPGESLAKYKDRIPAPPAAPAAEPAADASTVQAEPPVSSSADVVRDSVPEQPAAGLPDSLFTSSFASPYISEPAVIPAAQESVMEQTEEPSLAASAPAEEPRGEAPFAPPAGITVPELAYQEPDPEPEFAEATEAHAHNGASLSDDDVTTLAEQLAEAKHEEAQAEAEDLPEAEEAGRRAIRRRGGTRRIAGRAQRRS